MIKQKSYVSFVHLDIILGLTYFEELAISIEHIHGDLDVLLNALAAPFKVSSLKYEVEIVAYINYTSTKTKFAL